MIRKLVQLFAVMLLLTIIGAVAIRYSGLRTETMLSKSDGKIKVVTTFYPIYLIGLNIADQVENVEVDSLTKLNTGCLHDYQLTTEDMKLIATADVMVINGGGMEGFLEDVTANYPNLTIIDTSQGISMLPNINNTFANDTSTAEEASKLGEYNAHVWLDPKLYMKQIENFRDGLLHYINNADQGINLEIEKITKKINQNSDIYLNEVQQLDQQIENYSNSITKSSEQKSINRKAVIFHDSFAYLANYVGMEVTFTVPLDSDTALSAGDIAEIVDEVKAQDIKYLFTEQQYSDSIAKQIEEETNAKVYIIDSVVTGDGAKDSYLKSMKNNLDVLKTATQ